MGGASYEAIMIAATWSGGKDSCLAVKRVDSVTHLICMLNEENKSRAHGLYRRAIEKQIESTIFKGVFGNSSWSGYEKEFKRIVSDLKPEGIVFGDIFVEEHRVWLERVCREINVAPIFPLWGEDTEKLANEFISEGFEAYIVAVRKDIDTFYLGKRFTEEIVERLKSDKIDPCGENGEFHTFVVDGPLFRKRVDFNFGERVEREKYIQLEILID
jgi:uncharacterized protein (TIGR00290 family)